jgi:hypothetical protein
VSISNLSGCQQSGSGPWRFSAACLATHVFTSPPPTATDRCTGQGCCHTCMHAEAVFCHARDKHTTQSTPASRLVGQFSSPPSSCWRAADAAETLGSWSEPGNVN